MAARCGGIVVVVQIEPLSYILLNGLVDLAFEAWQELESEHPNEPYNPDWERYQKMENADGLRFFSLRESGNLIGYASIKLDIDEHRNGLLTGSFNDIFITMPKRGYAAFLVKYVEKTLSGMGVKRTQIAEKVNIRALNSAGEFYERMGYKPQEVIYSKALH